MKKTSFICLLLCFLLFMQCVPCQARAESNLDTSISNGCNTIDGMVPLLGSDTPIESVTSAILFEVNTNTLMYAQNADVQMYPASLVKIMTALIAFEEGNMADVVTVTEGVLNTLPSNVVSANLVVNEVLTLQDLLYCMLVGSANDAAAVIAEHIAGSQEAFVLKMNQRATQLGCTDTQFTDAHGLNSEQYTTARDMGRILTEALKNEQFCEAFGTARYTVPASNKSESRWLVTENYLLNGVDGATYFDPRATGSRTGSMDNGDRCIASVAEENGIRLISVVLGAKSVYREDGYTLKVTGGYKETTTLFDMGFDGFEPVQLFYPDQALLQSSVENGSSDVIIGPKVSISTILPSEYTHSQLEYRYDNVQGAFQAPIVKGSKQASIQVWYANICIAEAELYAMNQVPVKQQVAVNLDTENNESVMEKVLLGIGIVVIGLLALLVIVFIMGRIRYAAMRKRSRQHSRNRRRSR